MKELHIVTAKRLLCAYGDIKAIKEAYRLGQQEAGVDEQRFRAACAALQGLAANPYTPNCDDKQVAKYSVIYADALIAELNRTASDAEEGGEV